MGNRTENDVKQLQSRLDRLEELIQILIQRTHALEKQAFPLTEVSSQASGKDRQQALPLKADDVRAQEEASPFVRPLDTPPLLDERAVTSPTILPSQESLESTIGGNVLNKTGMVAIILGISYFLKYAIENQWIGETGRVTIGILVGLSFLAWGEYLQRKTYRGYSITVLGGGIAILYFSIFAAFNFYNLLSQLPALFIMVIITATAVVMSVRYDSLTVAVFATVGGFLTPALLSTGRDNQVGLFLYIALLDLGVLSLAYLKNWGGLNVLSFFFTHLVFLAWSISFYNEGKLWRTEFFLTLFFLIFAVISVLYNLTHKQKTTFRDLFLISANGALYFLWTYALFESNYFQYLGLYAVFMAILYLGMGAFSIRRSTGDTNLFLVLLGLSLTFLTLAIPIQLKQNWISIGWAVEAVILCWIGFRLDSRNTRWAALLIVTMVTVRLLVYDSPLRTVLAKECTFIFNRRGLAFLIGVLAVLAMAYLYSCYRKCLSESEQWLIAGLVVLANFMILFFMTTETTQYFERNYYQLEDWGMRRLIRSKMQLAVSALWGIHSIILVTIGILRRFRPIRLLAILLFAVTIFKVFLVDLQEMEKIYRIVASIGLGVILLAVSMMYQKYRAQINDLVLK